MASDPAVLILQRGAALVLEVLAEAGMLRYDPAQRLYTSTAGSWDAIVIEARIDEKLGIRRG